MMLPWQCFKVMGSVASTCVQLPDLWELQTELHHYSDCFCLGTLFFIFMKVMLSWAGVSHTWTVNLCRKFPREKPSFHIQKMNLTVTCWDIVLKTSFCFKPLHNFISCLPQFSWCCLFTNKPLRPPQSSCVYVRLDHIQVENLIRKHPATAKITGCYLHLLQW